MAFSGTKTNCVVDTAYDPDALIMDSTTDFDDLLVTTLDGAINASVTSVILTDAGNFPDGAGTILIQSEQITYTGKSTNTLTGCTRGANSTTAATHADDLAVIGFFDDAELLFDSGGTSGTVVSTANYAFATVADLGSKFTSRVTPSMTQTVDDRVNLFDSASGDWDDKAGNFDGNAASGSSSILSFAYSDDNVTYTDFQQLLAGSDVSARYIKFKLDMTSDGDVSPVITALSVSIDMPDIIQSERNKSIGSGGTTITFPSAFYAIPDVGVTIHSSATGDYFVLSSITVSAFTINIYNSSAAGKTGTIDYMARKY